MVKKFIITVSSFILLTIFFSSIVHLYEKKNAILSKLGININHDDHGDERRFLVNPLKQSDRQIPPQDINNLKINDNAEILGQWSSPIDWNVTAIHSILLPDESVMTFGSFGIEKKEEDKDIRSNKKITITKRIFLN